MGSSAIPNPLQDSTFYKPQFVNKLVNDMVVVGSALTEFNQYIPDYNQPEALGDEIVIDVKITSGGMTAATENESSAPIVTSGGAYRRSFMPPSWREKAVVSASDFKNIRKLGTLNTLMSVQDVVTEKTTSLRLRLENRLAWLRTNAIQAVAPFAAHGNGNTVNLDYSAFGFHPAVTTSWDAINADIIDDIITFIGMFRNTGMLPKQAYFGTTVLDAMMSDTTLRDIFLEQIKRNVQPTGIFNTIPTPGALDSFLGDLFSPMGFSYYNAGPYLTMTVDKNTTAATTLSVEGTMEVFFVADVVDLVENDGTVTDVTIAAIDRVRGYVTLSAPVTVARGSLLRKKYELMYDDSFVIMASMPAGQEGGQDVAQMVFTANEHGPGGMDNMQSGIVGKTIDRTNEDPPSREIIIAANAAPAVFHPIGCWLSGTVLL